MKSTRVKYSVSGNRLVSAWYTGYHGKICAELNPETMAYRIISLKMETLAEGTAGSVNLLMSEAKKALRYLGVRFNEEVRRRK